MKRIAGACVVVCLISVFSAAQFKLQEVCGAPVVHQDANGNADEVGCPSDTAKQCKISLSFLKCLSQQGEPDPAIVVNRDDLVEWYSDQVESTNKTPYLIAFSITGFTQLDHTIHRNCSDPQAYDQEPFPKAKSHGYDFIYTENVHHNSRIGTCFKHVLKLKDPDNGEYDLDPHVIIGNGTAIFSPQARAWLRHEKNAHNSQKKQSSSRSQGDHSNTKTNGAKPSQQTK